MNTSLVFVCHYLFVQYDTPLQFPGTILAQLSSIRRIGFWNYRRRYTRSIRNQLFLCAFFNCFLLRQNAHQYSTLTLTDSISVLFPFCYFFLPYTNLTSIQCCYSYSQRLWQFIKWAPWVWFSFLSATSCHDDTDSKHNLLQLAIVFTLHSSIRHKGEMCMPRMSRQFTAFCLCFDALKRFTFIRFGISFCYFVDPIRTIKKK